MTKKISAETVNSNRAKYFTFMNLETARRFAKETTKGKPKQIYKMPNGVYIVRKGTYKGSQ